MEPSKATGGRRPTGEWRRLALGPAVRRTAITIGILGALAAVVARAARAFLPVG